MKARETMEQFRMLENRDAVLAAFSGGADSSALLHLLCSLRGERGLRVFAAHVNHGLRGEEAARDEAFVRARCADWGVPLFVLQAYGRAQAARTGESEELCGRRLRYAFLGKKAEELGAKIATAHTLSDSVETMLLNLTRGTGLAGLCGIPPVRGNIIRPLIETTRTEVEAYCAENALDYVTDSTNFSRAYGRNRVRLDVVPVLRALNPAFEQACLRSMRFLAQDGAVLASMAETLLEKAAVPDGLAADMLRNSPLCARALALAAARASGVSPEAVHVRAMEELLRKGAGRTQLKGGWFALLRRGALSFARAGHTVEAHPPLCVPLAPGLIENGPACLEVKRICAANVKNFESFCNRYFKSILNCDKIKGKAVVRTRRAGDFYHPAGRGVGKSLKKLLNEQAVPPDLRPFVPVVADEAGIAWVGGLGPDARCVPDAHTREVWFFAYNAEGRKGTAGDGGY